MYKKCIQCSKNINYKVILQNYFRKLSFLKKSLLEVFKKKKKIQCYKLIFAVAAVENLAGVATCREGGGGLEVHMNLMPPRIPKVSFFPIFWTFWAASNGRHKSLPNSILCYL
jgi:hypothetical protein